IKMDENLEYPMAESPIIRSPMIESPITRSPMIESQIVENPMEETQIEEIHLIEDQGESSLLQNTLRKHKSRKNETPEKREARLRHLLELEASLTDNSSQDPRNIESESDIHMDELNTQYENNLLQNIESVTNNIHVNELNLQNDNNLVQNIESDTNLLQNNITILVNSLSTVLDKYDKVLL
ncbi:1327_t:CDS:2, partial [Gigaspora rosea]